MINAISFGLVPAAYANVPADGIASTADMAIGLFNMVMFDQKMMAMFSLLFGVGVVVFAERAAAKGRRVVWLSLWRFALLFVIGVLHVMVWEGDILMVYALCAPLVLVARRLPNNWLFTFGVVLANVGVVLAPVAQAASGPDGAEIGEFWIIGAADTEQWGYVWFIVEGFGRALGLMLIGVAMYRQGVVQGARSDRFYRRLALGGIGGGLAITIWSPVSYEATDWAATAAIVARIPVLVGTIPLALGYVAVGVMYNRHGRFGVDRLRMVGRMALTNYLTQTVLGVTTLGLWLEVTQRTRTMIAVWIVGVWALQLWWSTAWLKRFRYGPFEWLWRSATYRSWQPMRRPVVAPRP